MCQMGGTAAAVEGCDPMWGLWRGNQAAWGVEDVLRQSGKADCP
jgi:hypothetical protein